MQAPDGCSMLRGGITWHSGMRLLSRLGPNSSNERQDANHRRDDMCSATFRLPALSLSRISTFASLSSRKEPPRSEPPLPGKRRELRRKKHNSASVEKFVKICHSVDGIWQHQSLTPVNRFQAVLEFGRLGPPLTAVSRS